MLINDPPRTFPDLIVARPVGLCALALGFQSLGGAIFNFLDRTLGCSDCRRTIRSGKRAYRRSSPSWRSTTDSRGERQGGTLPRADHPRQIVSMRLPCESPRHRRLVAACRRGNSRADTLAHASTNGPIVIAAGRFLFPQTSQTIATEESDPAARFHCGEIPASFEVIRRSPRSAGH